MANLLHKGQAPTVGRGIFRTGERGTARRKVRSRRHALHRTFTSNRTSRRLRRCAVVHPQGALLGLLPGRLALPPPLHPASLGGDLRNPPAPRIGPFPSLFLGKLVTFRAKSSNSRRPPIRQRFQWVA